MRKNMMFFYETLRKLFHIQHHGRHSLFLARGKHGTISHSWRFQTLHNPPTKCHFVPHVQPFLRHVLPRLSPASFVYLSWKETETNQLLYENMPQLLRPNLGHYHWTRHNLPEPSKYIFKKILKVLATRWLQLMWTNICPPEIFLK